MCGKLFFWMHVLACRHYIWIAWSMPKNHTYTFDFTWSIYKSAQFLYEKSEPMEQFLKLKFGFLEEFYIKTRISVHWLPTIYSLKNQNIVTSLLLSPSSIPISSTILSIFYKLVTFYSCACALLFSTYFKIIKQSYRI